MFCRSFAGAMEERVSLEMASLTCPTSPARPGPQCCTDLVLINVEVLRALTVLARPQKHELHAWQGAGNIGEQ